LQAANETKIAKGTAKVPKYPSTGHIYQNLEVENDLIMLNNIFSAQNWAFYTNLSEKYKK